MDEVRLEGPASGELVTLIHGWPDDLRLWDDLVAVLLTTGRYRCLRVTLPGYGDNVKPGSVVVDPNFHEAGAMVAEVIQQHRRHEREQTILVIHDWGSVVGVQLQRLFPELVSRMVICDIGPVEFLASAYVMIGSGLYYQWINSLAFWLWRAVPVVGKYLGDAIHHAEVRRFKKFPDGRPHPRTNFQQSASAAYFYHYFQANYWLDSFFGFSLRGGSPLAPAPRFPAKNPSCPTLFLYGSKGLGGLFKKWMSELRERPDCDVARLQGTHWFMIDNPKDTCDCVVDWLSNEQGGKLQTVVQARVSSNIRSKL